MQLKDLIEPALQRRNVEVRFLVLVTNVTVGLLLLFLMLCRLFLFLLLLLLCHCCCCCATGAVGAVVPLVAVEPLTVAFLLVTMKALVAQIVRFVCCCCSSSSCC